MNDANLKPCPFCGGKAVIKRAEHGGIVCSSGSCGNCCCPGYVDCVPPQPETEAVSPWSRRAPK